MSDPSSPPADAPSPHNSPVGAPPRRPLPVLASIIVALSVAIMIGLGIWQLMRADEKQAQLQAFTANLGKETSLPAAGPVPEAQMFRTTRAQCVRVTGWKQVGGRAQDGRSGFRFLAECGTGAEGPGFVVDMGVSEDPQMRIDWRGGVIEGVLIPEPVEGGLFARLTGRIAVARPMIVAATPAPGLTASRSPNPADLPNNSLSYAVQWFLFAGIALVIYGIALRQRFRR